MDEQIEIGTISVEIQKVVIEYVDIMSFELPKSLLPRRGIDHETKWLHLS